MQMEQRFVRLILFDEEPPAGLYFRVELPLRERISGRCQLTREHLLLRSRADEAHEQEHRQDGQDAQRANDAQTE